MSFCHFLHSSVFSYFIKFLPFFLIYLEIHDYSKNNVFCLQTETGSAAANKNLTGAQVCISVGVIRACGLKVSVVINSLFFPQLTSAEW
jgi:hypothetical protein